MSITPGGSAAYSETNTASTRVSDPITAPRPFRRYLLWYALGTAAVTSVWGAASGVLLPNQVQLLEFANFFSGASASVDLAALTDLKAAVEAGTASATPAQQTQLDALADFDRARAQSLALVTTLGTLLTMLFGPVIGEISDRTRSRWGRRTPYILMGSVVGAIGLATIQFAPTLAILIPLYCVIGLSVGAAQSGLTATVADRVPAEKRGTASALGGLGNMLGGVFGGVAVGILFAILGLGAYVVPAIIVLAGGVLFVLFVRDRSSRNMAVSPFAWKEFLAGFTVALRTSDFRWVWIARLVLTFGYTLSGSFSLFVLQSYVRPALSQVEATSIAPLLGLVGLPFMIVSLLVSGRLSDKLGRRKVFVITASVAMGLALLVPLIWPTVAGLFLTNVLVSVAFGVYLAVDQAMFIDVLPEKDKAGRDLGVANLGSNVGQALAPALGAQVVVITGGYGMVYVAAAVLVFISAFAIIPVRGVR
ncbi:MFS transporter [Rathayibacter sp. VKM Ac-2760]|uniref:MFS transporter n=1 Tax=Rathayibacter sp. VKM Ac-2760 TaxID=2609253 RepID=UPI0013172693|nr:MFS transporter [Rathayibacter sp. VKM Ac-2760]QHC61056.1 MFS transporter [Rathayibacter sp. VKM Ac-2760]